MSRLINIEFSSSSLIETFKGNQICFISSEQIGGVGDVFGLRLNGSKKYFKIIDIWKSPKDFAIKFLWRMCAEESSESLQAQLDELNTDTIYSHIYSSVSWEEVKDLVKL